jgi:hypothetical protein
MLLNQNSCFKRLKNPLYNSSITTKNKKDLKINIFKERNSGGNKNGIFNFFTKNSNKNNKNQVSCKKGINLYSKDNKETFKDVIGGNYPITKHDVNIIFVYFLFFYKDVPIKLSDVVVKKEKNTNENINTARVKYNNKTNISFH